MNKNLTLGLCVTLALLSACSSPATPLATLVPATATRVFTQTAYPTYTPFPTYTPQQTFTPAPTYTALPTLTPVDTVEVTQLIVREVIVTATPLPAPTQRPTPVFTLAPRFTATQPGPTQPPPPTDVPPTMTLPPPTVDVAGTQAAASHAALVAPRPDGNYLVNVDIAPGVWRNDGTASDGTDCYWERLTKTNSVIDNYIGAGNGTMFVAADDFEVHMERCGTWTYIGQ